MKKTLTTAAVLMMIVVFPIASWMYLKSGFSYRMETLTELADKKDFQLSRDSIQLNGKTTLIVVNSDANEVALYDQFKDAMTFQMLTNTKGSSFEEVKKSLIVDADQVDSLRSKYVGVNYLLVDDSSMVRMQYMDAGYDIKNMVRHIATILPINEKKIKKNARG